MTKSTQDSDFVGKVVVGQKGTHHRCEGYQKPMFLECSCHTGEAAGAQELPSQLEQTSALHCN